MTRLIRPTDLQRIILSTASAREGGDVYPLASSIADRDTDVEKAMLSLSRRGLLAGDAPADMRITEAGIALIDGSSASTTDAPVQQPTPEAPPRQSKIDTVLALLQRGKGATVSDLIKATGWLPHTTRAALTGLRKKGHAIERSKCDSKTVYHVGAAA